MKKIAACAVMTLLGSTSVFRGLAALRERRSRRSSNGPSFCLTTQRFPKNSARPFASALARLTPRGPSGCADARPHSGPWS